MSKLVDRRQVLRGLGAGLLVACTGSDSRVDSGPGADVPTAGPWATGGTAAMTGKSSYPDPFAAAATSCMIVSSSTAGPCTTASDLDREDISEGWRGLPMRLGLRIVDTACNPIAGALVKIWHTNIEGSYSGQTPNNAMCLLDQGYSSQDFMRGVRTTNADGIVYFDTCFPGWYSGRAIHIHVQVSSGATTYRTSQLFFAEELVADVFANHAEYKVFGQPNRSLASDGVAAGISSADLGDLLVEWARMSDGALLASKTIAVTT